MELSPDLRQNLMVTIYLLFSHNQIAIAYFVGLLLAIFISLKKPSRFAIFLLLGFAILLFSFEYDKHIIAGLREQTIKSLITVRPHYQLQRLINIVISELLPIFFYVLGWVLIFAAMIYAAFKMNDVEKKTDSSKKRSK